MIKQNKIYAFGIIFILVVTFLSSFISAKNITTINDFLIDVKANPDNYYLYINRSSEEILSLNMFTSAFKNILGVSLVSNQFIEGKDFIFLDYPFSEFSRSGAIVDRQHPYVELYVNQFAPNIQNPDLILPEMNFMAYNFLVIHSDTQEFYYNYSNLTQADLEFSLLDLTGDGIVSEDEMILYYLIKLSSRVLDLENPINTDFILIDKNEPVLVLYGQRYYCEGFNGNSVYLAKNFSYIEASNSLPKFVMDTCFDDKILSEVVCNNRKIETIYAICPENTRCLNGACVFNKVAGFKRVQSAGPVSKVINNINSVEGFNLVDYLKSYF